MDPLGREWGPVSHPVLIMDDVVALNYRHPINRLRHSSPFVFPWSTVYTGGVVAGQGGNGGEEEQRRKVQILFRLIPYKGLNQLLTKDSVLHSR